MSGITPLLDTLLHQVLGKRVDTAPPRDLNEPVRPVDPGEGPRALHSDSRLDGRRPAVAPLPGATTSSQRGEGQAPRADTLSSPASTQTHFSPSARTIADLLLRFPAPPSVLSAPAPLIGASETPGATTLADRLQTAIRDSGLFYESHLSRWYRGEVSRQQLEREPQMMRTLRFTPASTPPATAGTAPAAPSAAAMPPLPGQVSPGQPIPGQAMAGQAMQGQAILGQAAQAAQTYISTESLYPATARGERPGGDGSSSLPGAARDVTTSTVSREGAEISARESVDPSLRTRGEPVHENLQGVVRHQLEMLVTPILRWEGDVWSGIFMALMIHMPAGARRDGEEADSGEDDASSHAWHSELRLTVPGLGELGIALWLQEQQLRLQLLSRDDVALAVLQAGVPELERRLRAAGLETVLIDARLWESAAEGGEAHDETQA
ncbi:flagellar hook-length control protein FliK [Billgrantia ethanolica]|uniref:Flagellar hook-length control protein FliK n=1 Tax=Billgrantia ethanolica TaxID=2733486 RepID=A0ABS9A0P9_9GAMM|nr:flagellar hook-length control protein FliK [Halomonas ethanolica]